MAVRPAFLTRGQIRFGHSYQFQDLADEKKH